MPDFIPTAQEQLKFLKNIQLILQSGSFSSTYKFALLISLSRLAIEKGEDSGESLLLEYTDIAEKFIELYWKQAVPYTFNDEGQLILNQNNGKQAAIVNRIIQLRQSYSSLSFYISLIGVESSSSFCLKSCFAYDSSVKSSKSFARNVGLTISVRTAAMHLF